MLLTPYKSKTNKKSKTIKVDKNISENIIDSGILLIQGLDPLSKLFNIITDQEYSLIGTYHQYTNSIKVNIFYIFDGKSFIDNEINDLIYLNNVGKIIKYSLPVPILINFSISTKKLLFYLFNGELDKLLGIKKIISNNTNTITITDKSNFETILSSCFSISKYETITLNTIEINTDKTHLNKIISVFVDMVISDKTFIDLLNKKKEKLYNTILQYQNLYNDTKNILDKILISEGNINKEDFTNLLDKIDMKIPQKLIIVDKTPDPIIVSSVKDLNYQINRIVNIFNKKEIPCIELNSIIKCINDLSNYYNLNQNINTIDKIGSGLIIISPDKEVSIPINLKSGNQILLSTRNFDISIFARSELIEILESIESIIEDDRYDDLRTKITEKITKII